MSSSKPDAGHYLDNARIYPEIFELCPDYRALLIVATGIPPGPCDTSSEAFLAAAENSAKEVLAKTPVINIPHVAAWRDVFKAFGAKPKKHMSSAEALLRRVDTGLPRINRLTDIYNAISIKHQIPLGGEDLDPYASAPFLTRAKGGEAFGTRAGGEVVNDPPEAGEPVWCDSEGVTCRRWNWRQCTRTALSDKTTNVLFILDALAPCDDAKLTAAADELCEELKKLSSEVEVSRRLIHAP